MKSVVVPSSSILTDSLECTHCGKKIYSKEFFDKDQFELVITQKDGEIERLNSEIEMLRNEQEAMVESFRISTDLLLERLKDLETANFGQRPVTAQVLGNIYGGMDRPKSLGGSREVNVLNLEEKEEEPSEEHV